MSRPGWEPGLCFRCLRAAFCGLLLPEELQVNRVPGGTDCLLCAAGAVGLRASGFILGHQKVPLGLNLGPCPRQQAA